MRFWLTKTTLGLVILSSFGLPLFAQTAAPAAKPPAVVLNFEQRVRMESWNDINDWNSAVQDARTHYRFRTRLWADFRLSDRGNFVVGLASESRKITRPDTLFKWDEVFFENLYLDYRFNKNWSARVGRQNLMRGEGLILFEGTPGDGSRNFYFNAIDLAWSRNKAKLELLAISDPYRDHYLPRFNDRAKSLVEWNEKALALYYTDQNSAKNNFEAYWFYKTETDDPRPVAKAQPDRKFHTVGGRLVHQFGQGWSGTAEYARQWGTQDPSTDLRGWAGYAYVKKAFSAKVKPTLQLGFFGLSGDDPSTQGKIEGWVPVFGRWPKWSELYIYTIISEYGVSYLTNLKVLQLEATAAPTKWLNVKANINRFDAFHRFPGNPALYSEGTHRGNLFTVRADFIANSHFKGHVTYEKFRPGDFYTTNDSGYFLRWEVLYNTKWSWK